MDYFGILNLNKEPFSNSPDPDFFYGSRQHLECLQKLELALRLRRGLNVIIGDVGTGKTTLCRQLIRRFSDGDEFETHLILDPDFTNSTEFLTTVAKILTGNKPAADTNDWQLKELIKQYLFRRGVDEMKTVILIIDEGQKLPIYCLELLREFLNYETNAYKLLQIVIFAQNEFENTIGDYTNFADRINLYHYLEPMNFRDTRAMIHFRLEKSSNSYKIYTFFSFPALMSIYLATGGYPRKIINLCHRCILTMIIQNRSMVDLFLARTCIRRVFPNRVKRSKKIALAAAALIVLLAAGLSVVTIPQLKFPAPFRFTTSKSQVLDIILPQPQEVKDKTADVLTLDAATEKITGPAVEPESVNQNQSGPAAASPAEDLKAEAHFATSKTENTPSARPTYAKVLGMITLKRNETLSGLIQKVYGDYNSKHFKSLILANPDIDDPDRVKVGQAIILPAIPVNVKPLNSDAWWISLGQETSLDEAYRYLRALPKSAPSIRLVPYWKPQEGMTFAIVLSRYFVKKSKAQKRLEQLPPEYSTRSKILSIWSDDSVYFADPFFGRRQKRGQG
jgi:general secretion pathway protein A